MLRKVGAPPAYVNFNQDSTCICVANSDGISVYSLDSNKVVFKAALGAIKHCQMLFSTSLLAYVGSGEQPKLTPRKLSLLNTTTQNVIQDLHFPTSVLSVKLNMERLVAVLEQKAFVYALESLALLSTIETATNPEGLCALTIQSSPCYLALPSQSESGSIRVYDAGKGSDVLAELIAHKSQVAAFAWNHDGTLLASASDKGTVLRVHSFPQAVKVHTFRRGASQARVHCLAFSAAGMTLPLLACASSHGTIHLWLLKTSAPAAPVGLLSSVIPSSITDMVDPQRSLANLRLPSGTPMVCAIQQRNSVAASQMLGANTAGRPEEMATLLVVTHAGMLYTYKVSELGNSTSPVFALENECHLLEAG